MSLKDTLNQDLKSAMLSGKKTDVEIIKLLKSAILYVEVELKDRETGLSDEQVVDVLKKEVKKRNQSIDMYRAGGAMDKADAEQYEIDFIKNYLPAEMSDQDLDRIVDSVLQDNSITDIKDMGKTMGLLKAKLGSSVDGSRLMVVLKSKLK
jgi:uncharacterized protein